MSQSVGLAALTFGAAAASAQTCANPDCPALVGRNGIQGTVWAAVPWDPDGAGPAPEVLVVGGVFSFAND